MIGSTIGNYRVTAELGHGGMGVVYLAQHTLLAKAAAVKVLLPEFSRNREIVSRFFNEARAATSIRHPAIVEIFDFGYVEDGTAYIIMEYLDGESLAGRMRRLGRLSPRHAMSLVRQVAGALAAAHRRDVVHRDLKPDNIFIVRDAEVPGGERIKLLDFGIAKLAAQPKHTNSTRTGAILGTPTYMAPEQCRGSGEVDRRADLYSLGCVAYELMCGRPPFVASGVGEVIAHHLYFAPERPSAHDAGIGADLDRLVLALLEKEPGARPQSAEELLAGIDRLGIVPSHPGLAAEVVAGAPHALPPTAPTTLGSAVGATPSALVLRGRGASWRRVLAATVSVAVTAVISLALLNRSKTTTEAGETPAIRSSVLTAASPLDAGSHLDAGVPLDAPSPDAAVPVQPPTTTEILSIEMPHEGPRVEPAAIPEPTVAKTVPTPDRSRRKTKPPPLPPPPPPPPPCDGFVNPFDSRTPCR